VPLDLPRVVYFNPLRQRPCYMHRPPLVEDRRGGRCVYDIASSQVKNGFSGSLLDRPVHRYPVVSQADLWSCGFEKFYSCCSVAKYRGYMLWTSLSAVNLRLSFEALDFGQVKVSMCDELQQGVFYV